ncbi:MAG TPA: Vms1/Ankzf1 family peptidyl-tRNA hydrolase [Ktedonobacterales bacterium]
MATAEELLRTLARFDPGDALVLSVYLDMRPNTAGEQPGMRSAQVVLKDRLREIEKTLLPRGVALDEFRADAARVRRFFDEHAAPWLVGVALFACQRHQLFEVLETGVPFEDQVVLEPVPDLYQLAHVIDEHETAVVALVDTNTARLFVTRYGILREVGGPDDDTYWYRQRNTGGLNHKRYQRRIENNRMSFAREMAEAIEALVAHEGATRVVLAGDAVVIPLLHQAISPQLEPLISERVLRLDIRAPRDTVRDEVAPLLEQIEADESHDAAARLLDAVREQGLGVLGARETRDALRSGQADTVVLATEAPLSAHERNELVHLAAQSSAAVETVQGHDDLNEAGGVGALLRYKLAWV